MLIFLITDVLVYLSVAVCTQAFLVARRKLVFLVEPGSGRRLRSCGSRGSRAHARPRGTRAWLPHGTRGLPGPGVEPRPLHWQAEILNHCTAREVPVLFS